MQVVNISIEILVKIIINIYNNIIIVDIII